MSIAYLHIPKTAGISLSREMRKLGTHAPFCFYLRDSGEVEPNFLSKVVSWYPGRSDLSRYDVMVGHGFLDVFVATGADTLVTILREPRSRLLSSYFYFHGNRPKPMVFMPSAIFDRDLYPEDREKSSTTLNPGIGRAFHLETRAKKPIPLLEYIRSSDKDANPIHHLCDPNGALDTSAVQDRLGMFAAIGFTETLEEFLGWLSDNYKKELNGDSRLNVTDLKEEAVLGGSVEEIVHALNEKTAPDREIYRWAIENRREGFSAPPDPDETLERTMSRFKIV